MVLATARAAPALAHQSFDICVNPTTDVASQDDTTKPGAFLTVAGNIFHKGTIPSGGVAACSDITKPVIGVFYANVGLQLGLPDAPKVEGFVTWHFDFGPNGTFVTVGPIPLPTGVGQTYRRRSRAQAAHSPVGERLP